MDWGILHEVLLGPPLAPNNAHFLSIALIEYSEYIVSAVHKI